MQCGFYARTSLVAVCAVSTFLFAAPQSHAQFSDNTASNASAFSIPQSQLIQPKDLDYILKGPKANRPFVLQVGSHVMYGEAHIPGSRYAGPGSQPAGLQLLAGTVAGMPKNSFIVLYCGCCPWSHCPNVGPAYKHLSDLGFTNVKVLYLAHNFGDDWVSQGYRAEAGR
jgi:thiosulfate/3-mercaptopyruvate sulfurtransferase